MEIQKFTRATLNYSVGVFGSKVIMFALVPLYSFFLTKEDLGAYDLILVTITLFTPLITLQIADAVYRDLLEATSDSEIKVIFNSGLNLILIGYGLFGILAFFLNHLFKYSFFNEFMILLLTSCTYLFSQQSLRGLKKNRIYAGMGIANTILVSGFSFLFLIVLEWGLKGILWSVIASQGIAVILIVIWAKLFKQIDFKSVSRESQRAMLNYSWPLLPNAISWWLIDFGNRFIILFFLGEEYNGIYAVAARFAGIMALINSIFLLAWQDYTITTEPESKVNLDKVSKIFKRFMIFEITTIILLSSAARQIIGWTTDDKFHEAYQYFPILLMASGFSSFSAYFGAFYLKEKATFRLFTTSVFGGICNLIFSSLLVNQIGLFAVSIGSVLGFVATLILRLNDYPVNIPKGKILWLLLSFVVIVLFQFGDLNSFHLFGVIFASIIFVILNKGLFLAFTEKFFASH